MKKNIIGLCAAGIAAGGTAWAYQKIMQYFLNMALERETKHFRVRAEERGPHREVILAGEQKLESWPYEDVYTTSFDGLQLHGRFYRQEGAARTMVLVHGWRGGWNYDFCLGGPWLYEEGYNLLIMDQRAQGESEGEYMTMGLLERKDCHTWLQWLQTHTDTTNVPVYLMGISMGATTVLMAAGEPLPAMVKGIIADCGFIKPYDMLYHYGQKAYHIPEVLMRQFNRYCIKHAGIDLQAYSTLEALETADIPILFVHGKADTFVPCENTLQAYDVCKGPKKLLLVEDAPHAMSFLYGQDSYIQTAHEFFALCEGEQA